MNSDFKKSMAGDPLKSRDPLPLPQDFSTPNMCLWSHKLWGPNLEKGSLVVRHFRRLSKKSMAGG